MPASPDQDDQGILLPGEELADQLPLDLDVDETADSRTGRVTLEDLDQMLTRAGRQWSRRPGRRRK